MSGHHVEESRVQAPAWTVVSRPSTGRPRADRRVLRPRRLLAWVGISTLIALVAVAVGGVAAARALAERQAVDDAGSSADLMAESVVQPALTDGIVGRDPASIAALDEVVRGLLRTSTVARIKIWTADGEIVYSDESRLIGETFELGADDLEVLDEPRTEAEVSDLSRPENRFERGQGKMLEVYRPVWTPDGTVLLFETYSSYDAVDARASDLWRGFAVVTIGSLLLFVVLLLPIGWRLATRLRAAQEHREALLQQRVDASVEERRRIAATLHDGVVQDLAATAFAVAGAAVRVDPSDAPLRADLEAAADTLRSSIRGLRSLLVDIYPANLEATGLDEALSDLAGSLRARGVEVDLDMDADGARLDADQKRLTYRVAQECLQNVRRHARASRVTLGLHDEPGAVVLDVVDDGVGFDASEALDRSREGHFGLRLLADVATDVGAELAVATRPGAGAHWRLRVPVG